MCVGAFLIMALDTGRVTSLYRTNEFDPSDAPRSDAPSLFDGPDIGAALKAVREFHGVTLQDLADATRIRQTYLSALETLRIDELPSRPFAIGYVKAYARHLGLDGDAAVERFRQDVPDHDDVLRAPIGIRTQRDPRLGLILVGGLLVVAAFVAWNIAQRALSEQSPKPAVSQQQQGLAPLPPVDPVVAGPVPVGAPLPPPAESTTPNLYETPGLPTGEEQPDEAAKAAALIPQPAMPVGSPFRPQGQVFGAPAGAGPGVVVQARRNATFVVHGADGSVYFSNVLKAGQAYRLPAIKGLSIDGDPMAFDVFNAAGYRGPLPAAVNVSVSSLGG
jgi:cytoskeleton protein RodZ